MVSHVVVNWSSSGFQVFFVLVLATSGISRTSAIGADSTKANDAAASVFEILDQESKIDYSCEDGITITSVRGEIDFQNVCFKYPSRPNVQIFKDLSLSIPSGKVKLDKNKVVIYNFELN